MPTVDGIVSGLDTTGLIRAITESTRIQQSLLQRRQAQYQDQRSKVSALNGKLQGLADAIRDVGTSESLSLFSADVADDSQFEVKFGAGSIEGNYSIQTMQLAESHSRVYSGVSDKLAVGTLGTGTIDVTYGGTTSQITVDGTTSLESLAAQLNGLDGVSSYVVNTGTGPNPFQLVVQGNDTGAANTLTVDTAGLTGGSFPTLDQETLPQDAQISVDGIVLSSSTNRFDSQIPGMDLTAKAVGTAATQVAVSQDLDGIKASVNEILDAYNDARSYYNVQTVVNPDAGIRGGLVGDSSVRRTMDRIGSMITGTFLGDGNAGSGLALSKIGVKTGRDGSLSLDETEFEKVLQQDPSILQATFAGDTAFSAGYPNSGTALGVAGTLKISANEQTVSVAIDATDTLASAAAKLGAVDGLNAELLDIDGVQRLMLSPDTGNKGLFKVEADGAPFGFLEMATTGSGDPRLSGGPLVELASMIEDAIVGEDGTLTLHSESLTESIDDLNDRIEVYDRRLEKETARLRARFSSLEGVLGSLQTTQSFVASAFGGASLF